MSKQITVTGTATGYKFKIKETGKPATVFELTEKETETLKIRVMDSWWQKSRKQKKDETGQPATVGKVDSIYEYNKVNHTHK